MATFHNSALALGSDTPARPTAPPRSAHKRPSWPRASQPTNRPTERQHPIAGPIRQAPIQEHQRNTHE